MVLQLELQLVPHHSVAAAASAAATSAAASALAAACSASTAALAACSLATVALVLGVFAPVGVGSEFLFFFLPGFGANFLVLFLFFSS